MITYLNLNRDDSTPNYKIGANLGRLETVPETRGAGHICVPLPPFRCLNDRLTSITAEH